MNKELKNLWTVTEFYSLEVLREELSGNPRPILGICRSKNPPAPLTRRSGVILLIQRSKRNVRSGRTPIPKVSIL